MSGYLHTEYNELNSNKFELNDINDIGAISNMNKKRDGKKRTYSTHINPSVKYDMTNRNNTRLQREINYLSYLIIYNILLIE